MSLYCHRFGWARSVPADWSWKGGLIRSLIPRLSTYRSCSTEVTARGYARKDASVSGRRHGSNPGTVGLAGQACPRRVAGSEIPLRSYRAWRS